MVDDELMLLLLLLLKLRGNNPADPKRGGVDGNASFEGDFTAAKAR